MNPANVIGHGNKTTVFPNSVSLGVSAQIEVGVIFLNIFLLMMCTWRCCIMLHPFQRVCRVQCHNSAEERENLSSEPLMSHVDVACGRMSSVDQLFDAEAGWISDDSRWFQHWNGHCSKASYCIQENNPMLANECIASAIAPALLRRWGTGSMISWFISPCSY